MDEGYTYTKHGKTGVGSRVSRVPREAPPRELECRVILVIGTVRSSVPLATGHTMVESPQPYPRGP